MEIESWMLFASIALVATLSPGPAILLVTTHTVMYGFRQSIAAILGNITGLFTMSLLSVIGLSTLILQSTAVFMAVKFLGAAYLIYLGVRLWKHGFSMQAPEQGDVKPVNSKRGFFKRYRQGLLVALSNPKAIAFTTALFPQFIDHTRAVAPQFAILVFTFMSFSFLCLLGYAWITEVTRQRARRLPGGQVMSKVFGGIFVGSGVALASAGQN